MSSTEIFVAREDGNLNHEKNFRNAWRGGYFIWDVLWQRYKPPVVDYDSVISGDNLRILINLREKMNLVEQITLLSTMDKVVVSGDNLQRLAEVFEQFASSCQGNSSLLEQAQYFRELHSENPRPRYISWNQTSVNGDAWIIFDDKEDDKYRPYSVDRDEGHWELFAEFD